MRDRFRDLIGRIVYRLDLTRESWKAIGIAVGVSLVIVAIILAVAMPRQAYYQEQIDTLSASWAYAVIQNQETVNKLWDKVQNITGAFSNQTDELNLYHAQLLDALDRLSIAENNLANFHCSIEGYLTGTYPDYKLYVKTSEAGNYTADVHLVYQPAAGNYTSYNQTLTEFYASINFTAAPAYATTITFNGTAWGISEVWFNIGVYGIEPPSVAVIPITCTGLNLTPSFAYVEVFKV